MTLVLAVVVVVLLIALGGLAWEFRRIRHRLVGVTRLFGETRSPGGATSVSRALEELEDLASVERDRRVDLESELNRLALTMREHDSGIVVIDAAGRTVLRNAEAVHLAGIHHAEASVDEVVNELLERALEGEAVERELQMFGPPPAGHPCRDISSHRPSLGHRCRSLRQRRLGIAAPGERAARLRRQCEPRVEDAHRRPRTSR
ncbi:MAG: hypothetical protein M5U31_02165 [Acidimicrobiia bacterium]|nr:hypothetical protein [Acidimicrobiia bacterium]